MLKKILLTLILVAATVARAESDLKTAASKAYVDTSVETLQDKIPAANQQGVGAGETVMTYTAAGNGAIGERGIYTGANAYNANTDAEKLITASALTDAFDSLPTRGTTKLECANQDDGCTLWTIVDQTAYGNPSRNLFDKNNLPERITAYFPRSGTNWNYTNTGYSLRFPCLPNTTYTARYNGESTQAVLSFASTNNDSVPDSGHPSITVTRAIRQDSPTINTPITLTTGSNDKWLIVQYNANEPQNTDMRNNLQIELGPTATPYEPYY